MSNIDEFLQKILSARYGKDVRQSIHDAIEEIDKVADTAQNSATKAADNAANSATIASEHESQAEQYKSEAEQYKNEAKRFRDEVETFTPVGYSELVQNVADNKTSIEGLEQSLVETNTGIEGLEQSFEDASTNFEEFKTETNNSIGELEQSFEAVNTSLEEFKTETTGSIENLEEGLDKTTFKVDTIIEKANLNIKNTASGENIHVTDSSDNKLPEISLYGKSKQYKTTGKSIAPIYLNTKTDRGITFTVDKTTGIIDVTGTSTEEIHGILYNFTANFTGMVTLTGSYSDDCCFYPWNKTLGHRPYTDETKTTLHSGYQGANVKKTSFYIEEGENYNVYVKVLNGKTLTNLKLYPMLRRAEIGDDTYEPYTGGIASPNPDYPQEIEVAGYSGNVVVSSCGKNLLNNLMSTTTKDNVTYTVNEDKSITVKGTPSANCSYMLERYLDKGKYILNGCPSGGSNLTYALLLQPIENNSAVTTYWDTGKGVSFEIPEDNYKVWIYIGRLYAGYTANNLLFKPMIRRCDENGEPIGDDTYEPYKGTTSTIQTPNGLVGIPVSSGGNYTDENGQQWICDEIVKYADGSGENIQRIKKVVYDGVNLKFTTKQESSKNILYLADNKTLDLKKTTDNYIPANIISSHFITKSANDGWNNSATGIYGTAGFNNISFGFGKDTTLTTVDLANEWLKSNNVTVYYELSEPIRTPLTSTEIAEIEKLKTFYPVTNLSNDGDCGMKVTYLADSKNYIDNQLELQKQAQEAAMINMLLLLPEETQAAMIENDTNNLLLESEE